MNSDEVADEVEYLQGRVTADMIKSYFGRGSESLRGNSLPFSANQEPMEFTVVTIINGKSFITVIIITLPKSSNLIGHQQP